jgi:hypothetical protein
MKKDDDEDDAPTYVLEDTKESLTKEEYEALVSGKDPKEKEEVATGDKIEQETTEPGAKPKDRIAEVGAGTKKRKAARIVNEEPGDEHAERSKDAKDPNAKSARKPKKKAKTVKLTFGDDEG